VVDITQQMQNMQLNLAKPTDRPEDDAAEIARQIQISKLDKEQQAARQIITGETSDATPAVIPERIRTEMQPFTIPKTSIGIAGIGFQTERDLYGAVDPRKVTPNVSVTEVINMKNPENVATWNNVTEIVDSKGNPFDVSGMSLEEKISTADRYGATHFVSGENEYEIPWHKAVEDMTKIPKGIKTGFFREAGVEIDTTNMTPADVERIRFGNMLFAASMNVTNPELARPLYAGYLNNILIRNGVDARGRAAILRERLADPTMGDIENVIVGARDTVGRSIVETGLWGVGEAIDWFDDAFGKEAAISDFRGRQAILDEKWPTLPQMLQDRYAQKGVYIDLSTAEDLAYTYSGLLPRATRLAAEMLSITKGAGAIKGKISSKELANFENFLAGELRKNPELKADDVFELYVKQREVGFYSPLRLRSEKGLRSVVQDRITTAYQIADSRLEKSQRAEVRNVAERQAIAIERRDLLVDKQQRSYNPNTQIQIQNLNDQISENRIRLTQAERASSVPKFMRDANVQDKYMIVGGAAVGHFFGQEFDMVDPAIGELVGIATGLAVSLVSGKTPRGLRDFNKKMAGRKDITDRKTMQMVVTELASASPDFARQIEANALRIQQGFDVLEAKGVDPKFLNVSLPIVIDLVTMRHFADAAKKSIATGDTLNMELAEQYQMAYTSLQDLNGELNRVVGEMGTLEGADNEFFEFMRSMSEQGFALQKSIENDLTIINEKGVGRYLNALTANSGILDGIDTLPEGVTAKTFPEAVGSLMAKNIFNGEALDQKAVEKLAGVAVREVNDGLVTAAAQIQERIGIPTDKQAALAKTVSPRVADNIHQNTSGSTLFAFQLEFAHEHAHGIASAPYAHLRDPKKVRLYTANGDELSNDITVNVFDVFQELTATRKGGLVREGLSDASIDKIIEEISDPIFAELARVQGVTVNDLLKDFKADLEGPDYNYRFKPKRSVQAQVAEFLQESEMAEGFDANMFRIDPLGIKNLDRFISQEAYKLKDTNAGISRALYNISDKTLANKMNEFVVDGVPAGQIMIELPEVGRIPLATHFEEIGKGWRQYKEIFHDKTGGAFIPNLMFNNRIILMKPDAAFPTGISTRKLPSQWLPANQLFQKDSAEIYMKAVNGAMGREIVDPVSGMLTRRLVEGDPFTQGQQAVVKTVVGEWVNAQIVQGDMSMDEIAQTAKAASDNIRMVSADGTKDVPLVDFMSIVDDHTRFSRKSIGAARYDQEMDKVEAEIQTQLELATEPARKLSDGLKDAATVIDRLTSDNLRGEDIATTLIGGGMERYNQIRNNMLTLTNEAGAKKYTVEQVDDILANAYINGMRRKLFAKTGRKEAKIKESLDGRITTTFSDMLAENPAALMRFLGETPEEKAVAMQILGKDRYETAEAIASVLTELTDNPLASSNIAVRGIPRALSVESYISRFYAINRGVVRPQYVGTEALLQTLRFKKAEFLTAILTDPQLGRDFLEMVRTQKPLSPERNRQFFSALVQHHALFSQAMESDRQEVIDPAGRKFSVDATLDDKYRLGYPSDYEGLLDLPSMRPRENLFGPGSLLNIQR